MKIELETMKKLVQSKSDEMQNMQKKIQQAERYYRKDNDILHGLKAPKESPIRKPIIEYQVISTAFS